MRRIISDDEFEQALTGAQRSLFRFEQQPAYAIDDEGGLFAAFEQRGELLDPNQAPGLRAWFEQVRAQRNAGVAVERVRVIDDPPTAYQRWLQGVDRWNRNAGEVIGYLPRRAIQSGTGWAGLSEDDGRPFDGCDWWLIDQSRAVVLHIDRDGIRTKIEMVESGLEVALAIQFAWRAMRQAEAYARTRQVAPPAAA